MGAEPARLYSIALNKPGPNRLGPVLPPVPVRERLPFVLPDFNRHSWVSELARSVWEPRIARVMNAWLHIEWLSVAAGIRQCGLVWVSPDMLPNLTPMWEAARLSATGLDIGDGGLQTSTSGLICVLLGDLDKIENLREAWAASDDERVGTLFGYPSCCRTFFHDVWINQRCIDTTWAMSENTAGERVGSSARIELPEDVPPLSNILWRWAGVRAVPHLPCKFDCAQSIAFGERLLELGRKAGYAEEVDWIGEILSWPAEWSALHGIAEVKSPIMKISTRTDATAKKWVVQWAGTSYPAEGAVGLHFPWQPPKKPMLTLSPGFRRGLAHAAMEDSKASSLGPASAWHHADNGFGSEAVMEELHRPVVSLARRAFENAENAGGNVLDLGCGNGALLAKICEGRTDLIPYGIDSNRIAIAHARQMLPRFAGNFVEGDLFDSGLWAAGLWDAGTRYELALLMPGRLLEVPRERATEMLDRLKSSCSRILLYVYPDWGDQPLEELARRFGLELEESGAATAAYVKAASLE